MDTVKICVAGMGARGFGLMTAVWLDREDVSIIGVCDPYEDRTKNAADEVEKRTGRRPAEFSDCRRMLDLKPDLFIVTTSWRDHIPLVMESLERGIYVACEVGGSYTIEQCWELVRAQERTGTPLAFLENCCFGREELMVLDMVRKGILGTVVHCSGRYGHDLRGEVTGGRINRHYRLENYLKRNCENYPTHELGPIAKILGINRGNRMLTLSSYSSAAVGLEEYVREHNPDPALKGAKFSQGDVVTTLIRCAGGETIELSLDTTLPRPYSRGFTVRGTKGMFCEDNRSLFLESENHAEAEFTWHNQFNNIDRYYERFDHPVWRKFIRDGVKGSHGGMDWLLFDDLFACVKEGRRFDIDVYDMAAWMAVTALSEQSVSLGGAPVPVPDFTCGKWIDGTVSYVTPER